MNANTALILVGGGLVALWLYQRNQADRASEGEIKALTDFGQSQAELGKKAGVYDAVAGGLEWVKSWSIF